MKHEMTCDLPSEHIERQNRQPAVEYCTRRDLERQIELLLDDEDITDGLDDLAANLIIAWAEGQIRRGYDEANRFSLPAPSDARQAGDTAAAPRRFESMPNR